MKYIGLVFLMALNAVLTLGAVEEVAGTRGVRVGDNGTHHWSRQLDPANPYELKLTVIARGGKFEVGTASAQSGGKETWVIETDTETKIVFVGSVPANQAEKQYVPKFNGKFQAGAGSGGVKGTTNLTWTLKGAYTVGSHIYEDSRVDNNGNPGAGDLVDSPFNGNKTIEVSVPLKVNNRANDSAAFAAATPEGTARFEYTLAGLKREAKNAKVEKNLLDPVHKDKNMVRHTLYRVYSYNKPSSIRLPTWKESGDEDVNPAAVNIWNAYVAALRVHEEGTPCNFHGLSCTT